MKILLKVIKRMCPKTYDHIKRAGYSEGLIDLAESISKTDSDELKGTIKSEKTITGSSDCHDPGIDRRIIITITQAPEAFSKKYTFDIGVKVTKEGFYLQPVNRGFIASVEQFRPMIQFVREEYYKLTRKDILRGLYSVPENKYTQRSVPAGGYPWQVKPS